MNSKERVSVAIDKDLLEWIDSEIQTKRFANRSHAIQVCILRYKESEEKKQ